MLFSRNLFPFDLVCNRNKCSFLLKCCSCVIGGGETTQRRAAILGSVKKVGNHLRNVLAVYASMFRRRVIVSGNCIACTSEHRAVMSILVI